MRRTSVASLAAARGITVALAVSLAVAFSVSALVPSQALAEATSIVTASGGGSHAADVGWYFVPDDGAVYTGVKAFRSEVGYATSALGGAGQTEIDLETRSNSGTITDAGLKNGTTYYYSFWFSVVHVDTMSDGWVGPVTASVIPAIGGVNGDPSVDEGDHTIELSWGDPYDPDFKSTRVLRSTSAFASSPAVTTSQQLAYEGKAGQLVDTKLTNDRRYYYTLFAQSTEGTFSRPTTVTASATEYSRFDDDPGSQLPLLTKQGLVAYGDYSAHYTLFDRSVAYRVTLAAGDVISAWLPAGTGSSGPVPPTKREIVLFKPSVGFTPAATPVARQAGAAFPFFVSDAFSGASRYGFPPVLTYRVPSGAAGTYYLAARRRDRASTTNQNYRIYWSKSTGSGRFSIAVTKTRMWKHPQDRKLRVFHVDGRVNPTSVSRGVKGYGGDYGEDTSIAMQTYSRGKWTTLGFFEIKDNGTFSAYARMSRTGTSLRWRLFMPAFGGRTSATTAARTAR